VAVTPTQAWPASGLSFSLSVRGTRAKPMCVELSRLGQGLNAGEVAGVAELVEVEHQGVAVCQQAAHHRTADVHAVGRRP
jgi:hypothetical protein